MDMSSRPLGTYGQYYWLMYLLAAGALIVFTAGMLARIRRWRVGQGLLADRLTRPWQRMRNLVIDLASQRRFRRGGQPWLFHSFFVWGFGLFLLATVCVLLQEDFGLPTFRGSWYLQLSLALDLFSVLVFAGAVSAAWRRWITRPPDLDRQSGDGALLFLLALLPLTGVVLEGVRMAREPDPWAVWTPVGEWAAARFYGLSPVRLDILHQGFWWGHLLLALGFLAAIPHTRLFHLIAGPLSLFFAERNGARVLVPLDFADETAESFGAGKLSDLHWKRLLEADACTGCGRCQGECPAWQSGKSLSPKQMCRALGHSQEEKNRQEAHPPETHLVGGPIEADALWACTTCLACETNCPMAIEHVPRTVDLRRYQVLTESHFPQELQTTFRGLETAGNPWGLPRRERGAWAAGLEIPLLSAVPDAEILLWPGCTAAYDPRAQRVVRSLAGLLRQSGTSFAILGPEETCCGDAARRLGNEYLFQSLAEENIANLSRYRVKTIITGCPHCFNALGSEYSLFGGHWEVIHHTVFLERLVRSGRLSVRSDFPGFSPVLHDSCYLARYHGIIDEPRSLLASVLGRPPREAERHGAETSCCGGGGGRMWLEERSGTPIRRQRIDALLQTDAHQIAVACPFCLSMLSDGCRESGREEIQVLDIAEILAGACPDDHPHPQRRNHEYQ